MQAFFQLCVQFNPFLFLEGESARLACPKKRGGEGEIVTNGLIAPHTASSKKAGGVVRSTGLRDTVQQTYRPDLALSTGSSYSR